MVAMTVSILFYFTFSSIIITVTPNTDVSPDVMFSLVEETAASCRTKSKKQLKEVEDAQLAAHRCMIRDVAVKVPEPEDFITEAIFPSHIVVPRCSGVCVSSAGLTCHPKKKPKIVSHDVVLYNANGSQVCRQIQLEHHKGPCKCSCQQSEADCLPHQVWYEDTCQCGCARTDSAAKHYCALDANRQWSDESCSCVCKMTCPHATELDPDTCTCGEGVSQCAVSPLYSVTGTVTGSHPAKVATYVGLVAIALVTLTILVTLYLMATKKRPYRDLRYPSRTDSSLSSMVTGGSQGPGVPHQAAYSITINQSQPVNNRSPSPLTSVSSTPLCFDDKTRL